MFEGALEDEGIKAWGRKVLDDLSKFGLTIIPTINTFYFTTIHRI